MPELPEVESTRDALEKILKNQKIERIDLKRQDLRFKIPKNFSQDLAGTTVIQVERRAKYLLIRTSGATILSHLGMTGHWRVAPSGQERRHDHCYIYLASGVRVAFCDPRRFGVLDLIEAGRELQHKLLKHLGLEPLAQPEEVVERFKNLFKTRQAPIKNVIMDQKVIVGVGNIYASEALFRAGIHPQKKARRIKTPEIVKLVEAIQTILRLAIKHGGTTIRDYQQASGDEGGFQDKLLVYDRYRQPCRKCKTPIRRLTMAGRSTYFCPRCQKK